MIHIAADYKWAGKQHRIVWEPELMGGRWVVQAQSLQTGEWSLSNGSVPVGVVAHLLGAPENPTKALELERS